MLLELSRLFLFHQRSHSWSGGAIIRTTPVGLTGPYFPSTSHLIPLGLKHCISHLKLTLLLFFFLCLFLCLKNFFFLHTFFFLSEGGGLGRRKPLSINRHFHQVFLNYHVGSQPLLCKLYLKKKSFQCRNPPWDCNQLSVLFSLKKDRPLGTALLRTRRKAKVAASCNSMI